MPCNKPKPERNDRIFRDVQAGMSHNDACAKYGLSNGRLNKIVCSHPEYKSKRAGSAERNAEISKLFGQGASQHEIARQFGVSRNVIAGAYARWQEKNQPQEAASRVRSRNSKTVVVPTREQIEMDRKLIAEYIAARGVKICPPVALVPTTATLRHNPGIDDRWNGSTGWPASDKARRARRSLAARSPAYA